MSSNRPLLADSAPHEAEAVNELAEVREAVEDLRQDLGELRSAYERDRNQLANLVNGFRALLAGGTAPSAGNTNAPEEVPSGLSPRWQMLRQKLGGRQAEFIDLLQHGAMSAAQMRAAAHCDIKTVYSTVQRMKDAGLLVKNGGKFSLKEL